MSTVTTSRLLPTTTSIDHERHRTAVVRLTDNIALAALRCAFNNVKLADGFRQVFQRQYLIGLPVVYNYHRDGETDAIVSDVEVYGDGSVYLVLTVLHEDSFRRTVVDGCMRNISLSISFSMTVAAHTAFSIDCVSFVQKSLLPGAGEIEWNT